MKHYTEAEAKAEIERFAKDQPHGRYPCPRCGMWTMADNVLRNALSRRADVYVCDTCGMQEAIEDAMDSVTPLTAWAISQDISEGKNWSMTIQ